MSSEAHAIRKVLYPAMIRGNVSPLDLIGMSVEGSAMMDVLYEALITGDVSPFQKKQAERILDAKKHRITQATFVESLQYLKIFPIRNIGVTRQATATFRAELQANGKVKVWYTAVGDDRFKQDLATLGSYPEITNGFELDPEQLVAVRLHDEGGILVHIPALGLIDYSNQMKNATLSTAETAFSLGLTLGLGALEYVGETAIEDSLLWADRIAWAIPAVSMVINDRRDWILKRWPNAGRALLDEVDRVNQVAGYYGWARLSVGTLRYLGTKVRGTLSTLRVDVAKPDVSTLDQQLFKSVDDAAERLVNELNYAEKQATLSSERTTVFRRAEPRFPGRCHIRRRRSAGVKNLGRADSHYGGCGKQEKGRFTRKN